MTNFIDDIDKMYDFFNISKEEFLQSYNYITETEYNLTVKELNENTLANLMRSAENILLARDSYFTDEEIEYPEISVSNFKAGINRYAEEKLTPEKYQDFIDICDSMAC